MLTSPSSLSVFSPSSLYFQPYSLYFLFPVFSLSLSILRVFRRGDEARMRGDEARNTEILRRGHVSWEETRPEIRREYWEYGEDTALKRRRGHGEETGSEIKRERKKEHGENTKRRPCRAGIRREHGGLEWEETRPKIGRPGTRKEYGENIERRRGHEYEKNTETTTPGMRGMGIFHKMMIEKYLLEHLETIWIADRFLDVDRNWHSVSYIITSYVVDFIGSIILSALHCQRKALQLKNHRSWLFTFPISHRIPTSASGKWLSKRPLAPPASKAAAMRRNMGSLCSSASILCCTKFASFFSSQSTFRGVKMYMGHHGAC